MSLVALRTLRRTLPIWDPMPGDVFYAQREDRLFGVAALHDGKLVCRISGAAPPTRAAHFRIWSYDTGRLLASWHPGYDQVQVWLTEGIGAALARVRIQQLICRMFETGKLR